MSKETSPKTQRQTENAITKALDSIDKVNPYATYLNDNSLSTVSEWVDTGSYVLNAIISGSVRGGIPKGRVTMLAGESMTGKTLFLMKILANAQKMGQTIVIFDTENAIDSEGALRVGLDLAKVKYVPCISTEQTRNAIYQLLSSIRENKLEGKFTIAIDSLGNLQSEMEISRMEKDVTSSDMGTAARAIKSLLKTCTNLGAVTNTTIISTNHVYDDPSAMYPSIEKNMPGGKSAIFLPSVTVQLSRKPIDASKEDGKTIDASLAAGQKKFAGVVIKALTRKNRFIMQYLEGEMYLSFATGLDKYYGLMDLAKGLKIIEMIGKTYVLYDGVSTYKSTQKGHEGEICDGKKIGYARNFRKDYDLWEKEIIPLMEIKMKEEWAYSSNMGEEVPDEL